MGCKICKHLNNNYINNSKHKTFKMFLLIIEWISTIIFLVAGVVSVTKYSLKAKVKIYLELSFVIANSLWMLWCIMLNLTGFVWTGAFYTILGLFGIFNFRKIHRKEKKMVDPYNWCEHKFQIIRPDNRLEQCINCKKIRSFPYYPYTFGEQIEEEKKNEQ